MENNKRHTRIKTREFSIPLSEEVKNQIDVLYQELTSAPKVYHYNYYHTNSIRNGTTSPIRGELLSNSIFKIDTLKVIYDTYSIVDMNTVAYNFNIENIKTPAGGPGANLNITISNGTISKHSIDTYSYFRYFGKSIGNEVVDWGHYSQLLKPILLSIDISTITSYFQKVFEENKSNYSIKLNNKKEKAVNLKKSSYPIKLGKMLASFKIDDKDFLLKILRYITKDGDNGSWQNAYNLERLAKYLNSLDKSILNEEIIQSAVDIAVISEILE